MPLALFALLVSPAVVPASAQTPLRSHSGTPEPRKPAAASSQLPITRVALYKNGVGFFEHAGRVTGDQSVTIDFTSAQLNDVLQSLTAIDLNGGRISGAGYNSTTPLEQQLKTLPLALTADPSDVDFYNAIRGARVQVSAPGLSITGRILSIDLRAAPQKDGEPPATERRFLTVISDSGPQEGTARTLELTSAVSVRLLDTALHTDVTRYLELLASTRNQGLRHLTLLDRAPNGGTGTRDLRVSYISEVPVWKSTYRILFTDAKQAASPTATLQGWSVIDNTTGSDWTNVHLDLIAGAPQSFIQPLSTPYYSRRPEIPLPAEAQLEPQTHDSGDEIVPAKIGLADGASESVTVNAAPMMAQKARSSAFSGLAGGRASAVLGGIALPPPAPVDYAEAAQASLTPQTTSSAFDDFFQYTLTDPITIRKNESALVPILQTTLPIERVTLWSPQQPTALRALWITNSSNLTLDRGSFSIVENGNFGGEGLLDPIHPGERRLLSYAADQAVRVTPDNRPNATQHVTHITIAQGVLKEAQVSVAERTYDIRNAAPEPRTVVVEHPHRSGWSLDSSASNGEPAPQPFETTPTTYRFKVLAAPGQTAQLHVAERTTNNVTYRLTQFSDDQLLVNLRNAQASPALLAQLEPVFAARYALTEVDRQLNNRQADLNAIADDQKRIRENLTALKGTAEERALASRYTGELNQQEDKLASIHKDLDAFHVQRTAAQRALDAAIESVSFDEAH